MQYWYNNLFIKKFVYSFAHCPSFYFIHSSAASTQNNVEIGSHNTCALSDCAIRGLRKCCPIHGLTAQSADPCFAQHNPWIVSIHGLRITYTYELADILLLVKSLQYPDPSFPVMKYIAFSSSNTRSGSFMKLTHQSSNLSTAHHTYFKRIVRLWNVLPPIDIKLSLFTIKNQIKSYMWEHFLENFVPSLPCSFHVKCPCNKCIYLYRTPTF